MRRNLRAAVSISLTVVVAVAVPTASLLGTGCQALDQSTASTADAGVSTAAVAPAGTAIGGGCGTESESGLQLCTAVSQCPTVIVDTSAMPNCGFRVQNGVADLICSCGTAICSMGLFGSCAEAAALLNGQTQAGVCAQVAESRCAAIAAPAATATATAAATSTAVDATPTATATAGNPACDRSCLQDCGGGAACASVCNCD